MRIPRPLEAGLILGFAIAVTACQRDIEVDPAIEPKDFVEAQFDPAHPIPVLRLIPSPTALAEKPDGSGLNVVPAPCELPSTKQCLALASGWPTTTPVTLFFSGDLDPTTLAAGIKFFELRADGPPAAVTFTATITARPALPDACFSGENGSDPAQTFTREQIPSGLQVVVTPTVPLRGSSSYVVLVESDSTGGLRASDGKQIYPSALFSLLNSADAPVTEDGQIPSALLRSTVQGEVVQALFAPRTYPELDAEQKATVDRLVRERASAALFPLYRYFQAFLEPLAAGGLVSRPKLVFATFWRTANTEVEFDPRNQKVPFPNVELLTSTTADGVQVDFAIVPCQPDGTPRGCDSPTGAALKRGLNTLDGFSTTAPMLVTFNGNLDPATIAENALMFELDETGMATGDPVPLVPETSTASWSLGRSATLRLRPALPLKQNTSYVVTLKKGLLSPNGDEIQGSTSYNFLKSAVPLVQNGTLNPAAVVAVGDQEVPIEQVLECSTAALGRLATSAEMVAAATQIETALKRERWQAAFTSLESKALTREDVLIAWTYRTQDITGTLDLVSGQLLPGPWDAFRAAMMQPRLSLVGAPIRNPAEIARRIGITETCQAFCRAAPLLFQGADCNNAMQVEATAACNQVRSLYTSSIRELRSYTLTTFKVTNGNPLGGGGTFDPQRFNPQTGGPALVSVPLLMALPFSTANATITPAAATIFQHGIGRAKEDVYVLANTFARTGQAVLAFDLPFHGARASDLIDNDTGAPCVMPPVDPEAVECDAAGECTGGCDGIQDPSATGFLSTNLFATRDTLRQATIDQRALMQAIQRESTPTGELPFIDGTRIGYVGQSLGGITGGNLAAFSPELRGAVLNVAGGGWPDLLVKSQTPSIKAPLFAGLAQAGICVPLDPIDIGAGCRMTPTYLQFLSTVGWVLDPGDPLATSIAVMSEHNGIEPLGAERILMQMAKPDFVVPNEASLALGRAYGFDPDDNSETSHFQTYDFTVEPSATDCHGFLLAPVCTANAERNVCLTLGAQEMAARFLETGVIGTRTSSANLSMVGFNCAQF